MTRRNKKKFNIKHDDCILPSLIVKGFIIELHDLILQSIKWKIGYKSRLLGVTDSWFLMSEIDEGGDKDFDYPSMVTLGVFSSDTTLISRMQVKIGKLYNADGDEVPMSDWNVGEEDSYFTTGKLYIPAGFDPQQSNLSCKDKVLVENLQNQIRSKYKLDELDLVPALVLYRLEIDENVGKDFAKSFNPSSLPDIISDDTHHQLKKSLRKRSRYLFNSGLALIVIESVEHS